MRYLRNILLAGVALVYSAGCEVYIQNPDQEEFTARIMPYIDGSAPGQQFIGKVCNIANRDVTARAQFEYRGVKTPAFKTGPTRRLKKGKCCDTRIYNLPPDTLNNVIEVTGEETIIKLRVAGGRDNIRDTVTEISTD